MDKMIFVFTSYIPGSAAFDVVERERGDDEHVLWSSISVE